MSDDKKLERSHQETLALIADKLSIERANHAEPATHVVSQPDSPQPSAEREPDAPPLPQMPAAANLESVVPTADGPPPPPVPPAPPPPVPPAPPPPKIDPFVPVATATSAMADTARAAAPAAGAPAARPPVAATAAAPPAAPAAPVATRAAPPQETSTQAPKQRSSLLTTYLPIAIALFSLGLSIYQGMLFRESINVIQRNVARAEYSRACREIIETYFQIKPRVGALMPAPDRGNVAGASRVSEAMRLEAQAAIAKFGGLGTYLANFQDAGTRARYTELTKVLSGIYDNARNTPLAEIDRVFASADRLFAQMNDDCARLSRSMGL